MNRVYKDDKLTWDELFWSYCRTWASMTSEDKQHESKLYQACHDIDAAKAERLTYLGQQQAG
jgi:hypothetical protein